MFDTSGPSLFAWDSLWFAAVSPFHRSMEVSMAVAITRTDLSARELRVAASKAKDAKAARRMLARGLVMAGGTAGPPPRPAGWTGRRCAKGANGARNHVRGTEFSPERAEPRQLCRRRAGRPVGPPPGRITFLLLACTPELNPIAIANVWPICAPTAAPSWSSRPATGSSRNAATPGTSQPATPRPSSRSRAGTMPRRSLQQPLDGGCGGKRQARSRTRRQSGAPITGAQPEWRAPGSGARLFRSRSGASWDLRRMAILSSSPALVRSLRPRCAPKPPGPRRIADPDGYPRRPAPQPLARQPRQTGGIGPGARGVLPLDDGRGQGK